MSITSDLINFLLTDELRYEIEVRGFTPTRTVEDRRKQLRAILRRQGEKLSKDLASPNPFSVDFEEINQSLNSLKNEVNALTADTQSHVFKRLAARFSHLDFRLSLSDPSDDKEESDKQNIDVELLLLEGEFLEHELKAQTTAISAPAPTITDNTAIPAPVNIAPQFCHIPVCKWNLKFSGNPNSLSLLEFLTLVEEYKSSRGVSDAELFLSASELFSDAALDLFRALKFSISSWSDLVELLKINFLPRSYEKDLLKEIENTFQKPNSKVSLFIYKMQGSFRKLSNPPILLDQLEIIINNLLPDFTKHLALVDVTTYEQLIKLCSRLEMSFKNSQRTQPSISRTLSSLQIQDNDADVSETRPPSSLVPDNNNFPSPIASSSRSEPVTCWNCNKSGHLFTECRAPKKRFCYGCGHNDTIITKCPKCSPNNSTPRNSKNESTGNVQDARSRPFPSRPNSFPLDRSTGAIRKQK